MCLFCCFFLCQLFVAYCSYLGKGFVLAPPKTVWDAVRNPRTRFTYDDTLKVNLSTYTLVSKLIICLEIVFVLLSLFETFV